MMLYSDSLELLSYLYDSCFPLKISDGAAEDILSLVKQRYALLEHLVKCFFCLLFRCANIYSSTSNILVVVVLNNLNS